MKRPRFLPKTPHQLRQWLASGILTHTLFPPGCGLCGQPVQTPRGLCSTCWAKLEFTTPPFCQRCGMQQSYSTGHYCAGCLHQPPPWTQLRAPLLYNDTAAQIIIQLKYHDRFLLLPLIMKWLHQASRDLPKPDYIIPIPLHRWRLWRRRFNQSAMLAQRLANDHGDRSLYQPLWLERHGHFRPQRGLTAEERRQNIKDKFRFNKHLTPDTLANKCVWLVDDVVTTGATIAAASALLQDRGAEVMIVTLARVKGMIKTHDIV